MRKDIIIMVISMMLTVACADLLYLYCAGAWTDPNEMVVRTELVWLTILVLSGLGVFTWRVIRLYRRLRK